MTSQVHETEAAAADAARDVDRAEQDLASGRRSITAGALHKLRDTFRHADLAARGAHQRAEAEREAARMSGLQQLASAVDELAGGDTTAELTQALQDLAAAAARVQHIAADHDTAVHDLIGVAHDLRAEPLAPAGPRETSAYVAVHAGSIVHRRTQVNPIGDRAATAIRHAAAGNLDAAVAEVQITRQRAEMTRPDHVLRARTGVILTMTEPLTPAMEGQLRSGDVTRLTDHETDLWMKGELG